VARGLLNASQTTEVAMSNDRLSRCASCGERAPTSAAYCPSCGAANGRVARLAAAAARFTAGGLVVASAALGEALLSAAADRWDQPSRPFALGLGALAAAAWLGVPIAAGVAAAMGVRSSNASRLAARSGCALAALGLAVIALAAGGDLSLDLVTAARLGLAAVFGALGATVALPALARLGRGAPFSWVSRTSRPSLASGPFAFSVVAVALATTLVPWLVAWIFAADVAASLGREAARVGATGIHDGSRGQEAS
jgi:hypothetical protein